MPRIKLRWVTMCGFAIGIFVLSCVPPAETPARFDVIIDTDLGGDPDDIQSLFRAVHYSDIVRIKGIVSTPHTVQEAHPWDTLENTELIRTWIQRIDVDHLRNRGYRELMPERELLSCIRAGSQQTGPPGPGRSTPGSDWIIRMARRYSKKDPLWLLVWGSMTTTAQALHDAPDIADKIRIYSIGSSNTLHDTASRNYVYRFMEETYPELWWIENGILPRGSHETFRGVYQSGIQEGDWSYSRFIGAHIRGHGTTRGGMFPEKCGDAFPVAHYPPNSLKEGDSPSLLFLISPVLGGVGDVNDPTGESWGGEFRYFDRETFPNYCIDLDKPPEECQWTIGKWRRDFLGDWKHRWDRYGEEAMVKQIEP